MDIRLADRADLPAVLGVAGDASAFLGRMGVDQWQDGYPPASAFESDIGNRACYVLTDGVRVCGMCSLLYGEEPSYRILDSGAWQTEAPYATVHRIALASAVRGTGAADLLFDFCEKTARAAGKKGLRIDTHADNLPMRHVLARHGFSYVGRITLYRGTATEMPRIAFEKRIDP